MLYVTGPTLCRLMHRHHVTIRLLAQRMDIPMTRIRVCRQEGIKDRHVARDWVEAITGRDPGMLHAPVQGSCARLVDGTRTSPLHETASSWGARKLSQPGA
jgi:hypothetical protein